MKGTARFRSLEPYEQALVAVAVLLDGHDAADYLSSDKERNTALTRGARDMAELNPDLRMPLLASILRNIIDGFSGES